jgi:predicted component of type VI protein secretion system
MPKLQFVLPDGTEPRYSLEGDTFRIGRAGDNDIVISDPRVSSHHLVLKRATSGDFIVNDLGATNPTRINGRPSQVQELKDGDTLLVGDTYARYESDPVAAPPHPAAVAGRSARGAGDAPVPGTGCFALLVMMVLVALGGVAWAVQ